MSIMRFFKRLGNFSPEDRAEFNKTNTRYNSGVTLFLAVISTVMLSGSMLVGYLSHRGGASGIEEFWLIFPYHAAGIAVSLAVWIVMIIIHQKNLSYHIISDIVAITQTCVIMALFSISSHVEIAVTGIKNINVFIITMFALGFFLRFRLTVTLALEVLYTAAALLFLYFERNDISNYYPSLVNVVCSFIVALCAAFMYWDSRKNNFISTKKLHHLASSDHLTRLHNRRSFDAYIEQEWRYARDKNLFMSLFIIDVDHFKRYNDRYGHPEGDQCLRVIADALAKSVRKNDFTARYGGEEFVAALTGANAVVAARVADKILTAIRKIELPHGDSVAPYVTVSIGCMTCRPGKEGAPSMKDFIKMADDALYMAKGQGRNRVVIHPDSEQ